MSTFPELSGYRSEVDGSRLTLPIRGVEYHFSKSIPMRLGLALTEAREQAKAIAEAVAAGTEPEVPEALENLSADEVKRALIGDQWQRMLDDDVTTGEFDHVYLTLFTWHMGGEGPAMAVWTDEIGKGGDARPPARSGSKARTTSPRSSSRKLSASTKPRASRGRNSSAAGN